MATSTPQLALRKPVGSDQVNVTTDVADNMQKIDDAFDPTSGHSHSGATGKGPKVGAGGIADGAITGAKIAADAVGSQHISIAAASPPASPAQGDLYFDTVQNELMAYKSTKWESAGGADVLQTQVFS